MRHFSHLNTAKQIITSYSGEQPFGYFIREFFKANKKYGSKDRKSITQLCYGNFRLGNSCNHLSLDERILFGLLLTTNSEHELISALKPEWSHLISRALQEKIEASGYSLNIAEIFPSIENCSEQIAREEFALSHLIQPDLFLRPRPGRENFVKDKLQQHAIAYKLVDHAIVLPNSSRLDEVIALNKDAVVQDFNSQQTGDFIRQALTDLRKNNNEIKVWDCCAASGGKSIMAFDTDPSIQLTVSDIRENILANLRKRLQEAGLTKFNHSVIDLTDKRTMTKHFAQQKFDLIIADVPCTGSGTWGRVPENLQYFKAERIAQYATRQKTIVDNVVSQLRTDGFLLYITCSVYRQENEEMMTQILENHPLKLVRSSLLEGYKMKADSMFAALFQLQS